MGEQNQICKGAEKRLKAFIVSLNWTLSIWAYTYSMCGQNPLMSSVYYSYIYFLAGRREY